MISLRLLDIAIVVLAVLIVAGFALVAGNALVVGLERLRYGRATRAARAALARTVASGEPSADTTRALARLPRRRSLALIDELARNVSGEDAATLAAAARDAGLVARAERRCRARSWRRRVQAARVLARLGGGGSAVPPLLDDPRPEVRAAAAEWVATNPVEPLVQRLVAMLGEPLPLTRTAAMDSLIRLRRHAVGPLAQALADPAFPAPAAAFEVAARIADGAFAAPAAARMDDPDPEIRAWAARVLGALGGAEHAARVARLLDDPDAGVRAAAAVALGRLGQWQAGSALAARLRDSAWRVRRDAALALRALGAPGVLLLERALRDEDPFARDMARHTLDLPEAALPA